MILIPFLFQNTVAVQIRCHRFDYGLLHPSPSYTPLVRQCIRQLRTASGEQWLQVKFEPDSKDQSYLYITLTRSITAPFSKEVFYSITLLKGVNGPITHRITVTITWDNDAYSPTINAHPNTVISGGGILKIPWCEEPTQSIDPKKKYFIMQFRCPAEAFGGVDFPSQFFQIEFFLEDGKSSSIPIKSDVFTLFGKQDHTTTTTTTQATTVSTTRRKRTKKRPTTTTTKTTTTALSIKTSPDSKSTGEAYTHEKSPKPGKSSGNSSHILKLILRIVAGILVLVLLILTAVTGFIFFQHPNTIHD